MQEDMPEPYRDENFICPIRPLLPAKQQLDIFRKKDGLCLLRMNSAQMMERNWFYRGRTPHKKQYNTTENLPTADYQAVKMITSKYRPDTEFNIWRYFAHIGKGCTEREAVATPRWCAKPEVGNPKPSVAENLLLGVGHVGGAVGQALGGAAEVAGVIESDQITNQASQERLGHYFFGKAKGA